GLPSITYRAQALGVPDLESRPKPEPEPQVRGGHAFSLGWLNSSDQGVRLGVAHQVALYPESEECSTRNNKGIVSKPSKSDRCKGKRDKSEHRKLYAIFPGFDLMRSSVCTERRSALT